MSLTEPNSLYAVCDILVSSVCSQSYEGASPFAPAPRCIPIHGSVRVHPQCAREGVEQLGQREPPPSLLSSERSVSKGRRNSVQCNRGVREIASDKLITGLTGITNSPSHRKPAPLSPPSPSSPLPSRSDGLRRPVDRRGNRYREPPHGLPPGESKIHRANL